MLLAPVPVLEAGRLGSKVLASGTMERGAGVAGGFLSVEEAMAAVWRMT